MYGKKIRELRTKNKMTQTELAEKVGTTQKNISKYELEQLDLNTETIIRLCKIFHESADYILGIENEDGTKNNKEEFLYNDGTHIIEHIKY